MSADDVWAGIPVELREKVAAYERASRGMDRDWGHLQEVQGSFRAAEAALADALRSLLSRLQEAEKERDAFKAAMRDNQMTADAQYLGRYLNDLRILAGTNTAELVPQKFQQALRG